MDTRLYDKLNQLRESTNWHESVKVVMDNWEKQLRDLEVNEEFLSLPNVVKLANSLKTRLAVINSKFSERGLSENDRTYLFAMKDLIEIELPVFSKEENDRAIEAIKNEIDYQSGKISQ